MIGQINYNNAIWTNTLFNLDKYIFILTNTFCCEVVAVTKLIVLLARPDTEPVSPGYWFLPSATKKVDEGEDSKASGVEDYPDGKYIADWRSRGNVCCGIKKNSIRDLRFYIFSQIRVIDMAVWCFVNWDKYILQLETNSFCNVRQINLSMWDKYILKFEKYFGKN